VVQNVPKSWWLVGLLLVGLALLKLRLVYFWQLDMGLPVPPGLDTGLHIEMVNDLLRGKHHLFANGYPQGFHYLIAFLSTVTNQSPLTIFSVVPPLFVTLSAAALGYLAWTLAGRRVAVITTIVYLMVTVYPLSGYLDGTYPNLLAGGVLAPVYLAWLVRMIKQPDRTNLIKLISLGLLIIVTHHLTAAWILLFTILFIGILMGIDVHEKRRSLRSVTQQPLFWAPIGTLLLAGLVYWPNLIRPLLAQRLPGGSLATVFGDYLSSPLGFGQYQEFLGVIPWVLGGIGLIWVLTGETKLSREGRTALILWTILLFVLSRSPGIGLPSRFVRELALPLTLLSGCLLAALAEQIERGWRVRLAAGIVLLFFGINLIGLQAAPTFPNSIYPLVTFSQANADTAKLLSEQLPVEGVILATPTSPMWPVVSNRTIRPLTGSETATVEALDGVRRQTGATYFLLIPKPESNPSEEVYPQYANFASVFDQLSAYPRKELIRGYSDGTQLFIFHPL
jgi:hypothetical protein